MNPLSIIRRPIESELKELKELIDHSLTASNKLLQEMLNHIRGRNGKMMRPILTLLMSKRFGAVNKATLHVSAAMELLHTASLVHDDVVDESNERRGQPSMNAVYNNKLSVLVGDYLLSTALYHSAQTDNPRIIRLVAQLGKELANGEILQLSNINSKEFSEQIYFEIIRKKTAVLFETCAQVGAISVGATNEEVEWARKIGEIIGMAFQIKDDIFDYYDNTVIGKPTGNDIREGKLTLPILHALSTANNEEMNELALKAKRGEATDEDIKCLIDFTITMGGIDYANKVMEDLIEEADKLLAQYPEDDIRKGLNSFIDYVVEREK